MNASLHLLWTCTDLIDELVVQQEKMMDMDKPCLVLNSLLRVLRPLDNESDKLNITGKLFLLHEIVNIVYSLLNENAEDADEDQQHETLTISSLSLVSSTQSNSECLEFLNQLIAELQIGRKVIVQGGKFALHSYQDPAEWITVLLNCIDEEVGDSIDYATHLGLTTVKQMYCHTCNSARSTDPEHLPIFHVFPSKNKQVNELLEGMLARRPVQELGCDDESCPARKGSVEDQIVHSAKYVVINVNRQADCMGNGADMSPILLSDSLKIDDHEYTLEGVVAFVNGCHFVYYGYNWAKRIWVVYDDSAVLPELRSPHQVSHVREGCFLLLFRKYSSLELQEQRVFWETIEPPPPPPPMDEPTLTPVDDLTPDSSNAKFFSRFWRLVEERAQMYWAMPGEAEPTGVKAGEMTLYAMSVKTLNPKFTKTPGMGNQGYADDYIVNWFDQLIMEEQSKRLQESPSNVNDCKPFLIFDSYLEVIRKHANRDGRDFKNGLYEFARIRRWFYRQVKKWKLPVNKLEDLERVMFSLNECGGHWRCVLVFVQYHVCVYICPQHQVLSGTQHLAWITQYLADLAESDGSTSLPQTRHGWKWLTSMEEALPYLQSNIPRQTDTDSCGFHTIGQKYGFAKQKKFLLQDWGHQNMPLFRYLLTVAAMNKKLQLLEVMFEPGCLPPYPSFCNQQEGEKIVDAITAIFPVLGDDWVVARPMKTVEAEACEQSTVEAEVVNEDGPPPDEPVPPSEPMTGAAHQEESRKGEGKPDEGEVPPAHPMPETDQQEESREGECLPGEGEGSDKDDTSKDDDMPLICLAKKATERVRKGNNDDKNVIAMPGPGKVVGGKKRKQGAVPAISRRKLPLRKGGTSAKKDVPPDSSHDSRRAAPPKQVEVKKKSDLADDSSSDSSLGLGLNSSESESSSDVEDRQELHQKRNQYLEKFGYVIVPYPVKKGDIDLTKNRGIVRVRKRFLQDNKLLDEEMRSEKMKRSKKNNLKKAIMALNQVRGRGNRLWKLQLIEFAPEDMKKKVIVRDARTYMPFYHVKNKGKDNLLLSSEWKEVEKAGQQLLEECYGPDQEFILTEGSYIGKGTERQIWHWDDHTDNCGHTGPRPKGLIRQGTIIIALVEGMTLVYRWRDRNGLPHVGRIKLDKGKALVMEGNFEHAGDVIVNGVCERIHLHYELKGRKGRRRDKVILGEIDDYEMVPETLTESECDWDKLEEESESSSGEEDGDGGGDETSHG
jgi:hypothetical protein